MPFYIIGYYDRQMRSNLIRFISLNRSLFFEKDIRWRFNNALSLVAQYCYALLAPNNDNMLASRNRLIAWLVQCNMCAVLHMSPLKIHSFQQAL